MITNLKTWQTGRNLYADFIDQCTLEQLNTIPAGFSNNLIWNIGHVIVAQQKIIYSLSGLPTLLTTEFLNQYGKGSVASGFVTQIQVNQIQTLLKTTVTTTIADFENNKFKTFTPYKTELGFDLTTIAEALAFNNYHEGIHLGIMTRIKKLV